MSAYGICVTQPSILAGLLQCYVSLYKHIILVEQLNREDNMVSCELLLMEID